MIRSLPHHRRLHQGTGLPITAGMSSKWSDRTVGRLLHRHHLRATKRRRLKRLTELGPERDAGRIFEAGSASVVRTRIVDAFCLEDCPSSWAPMRICAVIPYGEWELNPTSNLPKSLEVLLAVGVPFCRLYRGRGQAETGSIRVRLHIRGRGAQFAVAGARLLLQEPLRVCATTRAILLPKMTLATHSPHYIGRGGTPRVFPWLVVL